MELYRVGMPEEDKIIVKDKFAIDTIIPLCIKKISEDQYSILFYAQQNYNEESIYLQCILAITNDIDYGFLNNHPLNVDNIRTNPQRLEFYNEKIKGMKGNTFNTDFDMDEYEENKLYFHANALKPIMIQSSKEPQASFMDLIITRDNYIKISLFFTKFLANDIEAESVFISRKLNNITFQKITYVKLDGSSINRVTNIVHNHYTLGTGPSIFKMTFICPYNEKRKLRNPMIAEHYMTFYGDDFLIRDIIFDRHKDRIFIIYEQKNEITRQYKKTYALELSREIYNHTNFVDLNKIYE